MIHLLAEIPVQPDFLFNSVGIVALGLFIAEKAQNVFGVKKGIPQPMVTKEADEFVHRGSYESHCKINREEHSRIETKGEEERKELEKAHHALAREVSAISATLETNGVRLVQMDQKIDLLLKRS